MRFLLACSLLFAAPVLAQERPQGRIAVGVGSAGLGDFGAAFDALAEGYAQVAPGLVAQRAYPVWWIAEADAHTPVGPVQVGARVQGRWSQADALYGDYAGTVDVIGRASALLGEVEAALPISERLPLRAAVHGGGVYLRSRLTADAVATVDGQTAQPVYSLAGTGTGWTVGASLLLDVPVGPAALSARLGARWAHVPKLDAREVTDVSQTEGRVNLDHDLSGLTLTVGLRL